MINNISVIIPFYNQVQLTYNLLLNIIENTYLPTQIIVIDNGSTEKVKLITRFTGLNINYVRNDTNTGVNAAWNLGIKLVDKECKLVSILNNDITISGFFFEKINYTFNLDPLIGIAVPHSHPYPDIARKTVFSPTAIVDIDKREGWAFTIRKEVIDKIPPIPSDLKIFYGDDYLFHLTKVLGYKRVKMVDNYIFHKLSTTLRSLWRKDQEKSIQHEERVIWFKLKEEIDEGNYK